MSTVQSRLPREGSRPTSYQGMSHTGVWHHPLSKHLSPVKAAEPSPCRMWSRTEPGSSRVSPSLGCAPPIKCRHSCLPHRGAPFIIRCKVLRDARIKGAVTASSLIIIDYPFQGGSQAQAASPERRGAEGGPGNRLAIFTADDPSQGAISVHPSRRIQA